MIAFMADRYGGNSPVCLQEKLTILTDNIPDYGYADATCWSDYLWPTVREAIERSVLKERKAFDLGCGNGSISNLLSDLGFQVIGVNSRKAASAWRAPAFRI